MHTVYLIEWRTC